MSILRKCKKVLSGCIHKNEKQVYETDPIIDNDFTFLEKNVSKRHSDNFNEKPFEIEQHQSFDNYNNLQHFATKSRALKDTSNTRGLKLQTLDKKKNDENNRFLYNELYSHQLKLKPDTGHDNPEVYSQIADYDYEPLIDSKKENKLNNEGFRVDDQKSLTDLKSLEKFSTQMEAFEWYLKVLFDTMIKSIHEDKSLVDSDRAKRLSIANAHALYAHNFYQMKSTSVVNQNQIKMQLARIHPCLIVLACLLDSDAVRIVESHKCECDSYVYLFSTRFKFCAWKCRFYIILKRPNRSSIDRLTLIQDLTSCHKLLQDKPTKV